MKILSVTIVLALLLGSAAQAQNPQRRGRALLKEFCASCHAIGRTGASPMREAIPLRKLGHNYDLDHFPQQLERGISASHPPMPEFKFRARDARAAAMYLRSIQE